MKYVLSITFCSILSLTILAQSAEEFVIQNTQTEELRALSNKLSEQYLIDRKIAVEKATKMGWPIRTEDDNGRIMEIQGLDENGLPEYFITDNLNAARTISTNKVHQSGGQGFNLEGQNMIVGEWDGGAVLRTHQEFNSRVTQRDGSTQYSNHATHVAGTMIARGVVSSARGMAPQARLWAYEWGNDASEMASAASSGLLVSGHSYGSAAGFSYNSSNGRWYWYGDRNVSGWEDYKFGYYDSRARDWDQISRLAPYYLICKSAGNDRNDYTSGGHYVLNGSSWVWSTTSRKKDGDYNSISTYGNAKNILTVGAVNDIPTGYSNASGVVMTSFSCYGPTDDGRIKPDLVANGRSVYSTSATGTNRYHSSDGTSMSTPSVAGSLILLQQQYRASFSRYMRSASLKGLAIHTADEAGTSEGPDYRFGWGLMNTLKAAQLIKDASSSIEEHTLTNSNTFTKRVNAIGNRWVKITLCWTDYESFPATQRLNPTTLMLRNDLDVRLIHDDGTTYSPYILNPLVPTAAATKGDNVRDNVEKIYVQVPKAGGYTIRVSHKGSLVGGSQPFSLIVEGFEEKPVAGFTMSKATICPGDSITFTNTSSGKFTNSYWRYWGGNISTSTQDETVTFSTPGRHDIRLIVSTGSVADTIIKSITVRTPPDAKIINDTTFCLPLIGEREIFASTSGGTWDGGTWMTRTNKCLFYPGIVGTGDFKLYYTLTDANGCVGNDSTVVKIRTKPSVSLSLNKYRACKEEGSFIVNGGQPAGGDYFIGVIKTSLFNPSTYNPGNVKVVYRYTDTTGCTSEAIANITLEVCAGYNELSSSKISIYPNPVAEELTVDIQEVGFVSLKLMDSNGKLVYSMNPVQGLNKIDMTNLPAGNYFIHLNGEKQKVVREIIKY